MSFALVAASCSSTATNTRRTPLTTKELVEKHKPAIVRVQTERGVGTGFFVRKDGTFVTNLHVIAGAREVKVTTLAGTEFVVGEVLAADRRHDLAVLRVKAGKVPTLALGDSDTVSAGDKVIVIGNPLGVLDYTVSDGLISSVRPVDEEVTVLQISAPISQGSSGGPLFNPYGDVIGVATFMAREGQNLNFGIPSNYLRPLLASKSSETVEAFADRFEAEMRALRKAQAGADGDKPKIVRKVPNHQVAMLKGCSDQQLQDVFDKINEAIAVGAPVYNRGDHKACYLIYRGTANGFETDKAMCKGVRDAFGAGLLRAESLDDPTQQAWAMRDTFDGLLSVMVRKARGGK